MELPSAQKAHLVNGAVTQLLEARVSEVRRQGHHLIGARGAIDHVRAEGVKPLQDHSEEGQPGQTNRRALGVTPG